MQAVNGLRFVCVFYFEFAQKFEIFVCVWWEGSRTKPAAAFRRLGWDHSANQPPLSSPQFFYPELLFLCVESPVKRGRGSVFVRTHTTNDEVLFIRFVMKSSSF